MRRSVTSRRHGNLHRRPGRSPLRPPHLSSRRRARRALARDTDDRGRDPGWQHQTTPLLAADIGSPGTTKKKEEDECEGAYGSAGRHAETEHPLRAPMLLLGSATALRDAAAPSARADTGKKLPAEYGLLARLLACLLAAARRFSLEVSGVWFDFFFFCSTAVPGSPAQRCCFSEQNERYFFFNSFFADKQKGGRGCRLLRSFIGRACVYGAADRRF